MHQPSRLLFAILAAAFVLQGCSTASPIQSADASKSSFDEAVYQGESVTISSSVPGREEYRVFHQGATGFVSVQSVRASAERRANEYCARTGKTMQAIRETASKPPHILGNFPRIEIIFSCGDKAPSVALPAGEDAKYSKLVNLKKLLDSGVLTQREFESEKAKVLAQP